MALVHACTLCLRCKDEDSSPLAPLLDLSDSDLSSMTYNIIAMVVPPKLCVKCCEDLKYVSELLFKWRKSIILTLSLAKEQTSIKKEDPEDMDYEVCDRGSLANGFENDNSDLPNDSGDENRGGVKRVRLRRKVRMELKRTKIEPGSEEEQPGEEMACPSPKARHDPDYDPADATQNRNWRKWRKWKKANEIEEAGDRTLDVGNDPNYDLGAPMIRKRGRPRGRTKQKPNAATKLQLPEKAESYTCHICSQSFKTRGWFVSHVARHGEVHSCDQCGKSFETKYKLKSHLPIHDDNRYQCDQCDKEYARLDGLSQHKAIHHGDGVKRHLCRFCPKAYISRQVLVVHERTHTGERPFPCRTCDKKFLSSGVRRKHEMTHENRVKTVPCEICGNLFYDENFKDVHKKLQHNPPTIPCPKLCGRMFRRNQKARIHGEICAAGRSRGSSNPRVSTPGYSIECL